MRRLLSQLIHNVALLALMFLVFGCGSSETRPEIKLGAIFDLTGATSDVGGHYADGIRDYVRYVNDDLGGIGDDVRINMIWTDYQYKIPQAISAYSKFVKQDQVVALIGWGTGDSEALKTKIVQDQIPYISASFSQHLVWPPKWNFLAVGSYADQLRIVMKYVRENWDQPRNPRMALVYNDSGYGRAVLEPARLYAQESGIDLVAEEIVGLQDLEATSQMLRIKEAEADFVFIQETYTATATVLKEALKHNMTDVIFAGNYWSVGRKVAELAGDAAEGFLSITPFAIWSDDTEGVAFAKSLNAKYHPEVEYRESQYMAGIANAMVMIRAIEIALENAGGDPTAVTGADVYAAFEQMTSFDTKGITGPISYGPNERRGSRQGRVVSIQNGDLVSVSDWIDAPPVPDSERLGEGDE